MAAVEFDHLGDVQIGHPVTIGQAELVFARQPVAHPPQPRAGLRGETRLSKVDLPIRLREWRIAKKQSTAG